MDVLLFSGGLDSYITAKLFNPDVCLYVDMGSRYSHIEIANLKNLDISQKKIVIDSRLSLKDWEMENSIVPLRNLFFVLIGFSYGNRIMLSSTKGDTTKDKDSKFKRLVNKMAKHLITEEKKEKTFAWRHKGLIPKLVLPVRKFTKTQMVKMYLDKGFKKEELWKSRSCYGTMKKECGNCKTCFRKAVAFINNDIFNPKLFEQKIDFKRFMKETIAKKRRGEVKDTIKAMKKIGIL